VATDEEHARAIIDQMLLLSEDNGKQVRIFNSLKHFSKHCNALQHAAARKLLLSEDYGKQLRL